MRRVLGKGEWTTYQVFHRWTGYVSGAKRVGWLEGGLGYVQGYKEAMRGQGLWELWKAGSVEIVAAKREGRKKMEYRYVFFFNSMSLLYCG